MDPSTISQTLIAMLPPDVRAALEGGASPQELAQSLMTQRAQADALEDPVIEEPWPELGWEAGREPAEPQATAQPGQVYGAVGPSFPLPDERLSDLARAIGACSLCIGEIIDCPVCGGCGSPGWALPEPRLFETFVLPALERLDSEQLRRAQATARRWSSSSPPNNSNGHSTTS